MAYTKNIKDTVIDTTKAKAVHIKFSIGLISSIRSIIIQTPIGYIKLYIVKTDTPFLFRFTDIKWLGDYFNNIDNFLVMKSTRIPVICHFNNLFLLWENSLNSFIIQSFYYNICYLTEVKRSQLHRYFEHLFGIKLWH